jgi:hypothetical protein
MNANLYLMAAETVVLGNLVSKANPAHNGWAVPVTYEVAHVQRLIQFTDPFETYHTITPTAMFANVDPQFMLGRNQLSQGLLDLQRWANHPDQVQPDVGMQELNTGLETLALARQAMQVISDSHQLNIPFQ